MAMKLVLCDPAGPVASFVEELDSIPVPLDGAFCPTEFSVFDDEPAQTWPSLLGWAVADADVPAFERLFMAGRDDEVERAFPNAFSFCCWLPSNEGRESEPSSEAPIRSGSCSAGCAARASKR